MAESNSSTLDVDLGLVNSESHEVGESDTGEGLVDLPEGNVVLGKASLLEGGGMAREGAMVKSMGAVAASA